VRDLGQGVALRPTAGLRDALKMRIVRNECRGFMTGNSSKIGLFRQVFWWYRRPRGIRPYVIVNDSGDVIGYALMKVDGRHAWLTAGLLSESRGFGIGTNVFRALCHVAGLFGLIPALEVFESNAPGRAVYAKLGFKEVHRNGPVITMEKR